MDDATVTSRDDDLATCRRALDELVSAIIRHDRERSERRISDRIEIVSFKALMDTERMNFRSVTTNPVRAALRLGVRKLAQEVYSIGGMGAVHDAFERVTDMDAANEGRRMSIMDSAFNGVGSGDDRWWS